MSPAWESKPSSSNNSRRGSSSGVSSRVTRPEARSKHSGPRRSWLSLRCWLRRSSARTRASSSAIENGLAR
nr:hypothetical protein [Halomonas elongata]